MDFDQKWAKRAEHLLRDGAGLTHGEEVEGFLPQNLLIEEEWELLEACEVQTRKAEEMNLTRDERPRPRSQPPEARDLRSQ